MLCSTSFYGQSQFGASSTVRISHLAALFIQNRVGKRFHGTDIIDIKSFIASFPRFEVWAVHNLNRDGLLQ